MRDLREEEMSPSAFWTDNYSTYSMGDIIHAIQVQGGGEG